MLAGIFKKVGFPYLELFDSQYHFDIYIKDGNQHYSKVISAGQAQQQELLCDLLAKGYCEFYIDGPSLDRYLAMIHKVSSLLTESLNKVEITQIIDYVVKFVRLNKYLLALELKAPKEIIETSGSIVEQALVRICHDSDGFYRVFKSVARYPHLTKHAVCVALMSVLIAQKMEVESEKNLLHMATGALLADSGLGQLTFNPELEESLSPEQRKELWRHPELGKFLLDRIKSVPPAVVSIVLQHHERPNGHGYPNGLRSKDISRPAKIVAVADSFSAMISKRAYRQALEPSEALEKMRHDVGKFDPEVMSAFFSLYR